MPVDTSLVGRSFGPTAAYDVTDERVQAFAASTGTPWEPGDPAPVTFPIVVSFEAMTALMDDVAFLEPYVEHAHNRFPDGARAARTPRS